MLPIVPCVVGLTLWGISWLPIAHQCSGGGIVVVVDRRGNLFRVRVCDCVLVCVFSIHDIRHMNFHSAVHTAKFHIT